jgi:hypothetical protein
MNNFRFIPCTMLFFLLPFINACDSGSNQNPQELKLDMQMINLQDAQPTSDAQSTSDAQPTSDAQSTSQDNGMQSNVDMMMMKILDPHVIDDLIPLIAQNQCRIFRDCCEDQALEEYFFSIQNSSSYSDELKTKLPPQKSLGDDCEAILSEVLSIAPFGDWVRGVKANLIQYKAESAIVCLDQMKNATCGQSTYDVLFDSTCFSLVAPSGGDIQRKAFDRLSREGSACHPIRDGIGASFYGTCDPFNAFCCIADEEGKCIPGSPDQTGICKAVSSIGQACQAFPIQLCQTGLNCDPIENRCVIESTMPLSVGALCYDQFNLLGVCIDSYCDVSGSNHCEALIEDGQPCASSYGCRSQACQSGICGPISFCTGKSQ